MKKTTSGFTLVELLIVIVVIAILAAISIVAYNGIQDRAKLAAQVSEMDTIGKAIQLWSAEQGHSLGYSNAGYYGSGYGSFVGDSGQYTSTSIQELLQDAGYLGDDVGGEAFSANTVLLSPCTDRTSTKWVVMARVSPPPEQPIADQIAETGCTASLITLYTDPSGSYKRNLVRAY